jgi:hypothetical protein
VLLREILVTAWLQVLDRKTRFFDRATKDVDVKKIDEVRQSVPPLRRCNQARVERAGPRLTSLFSPPKVRQKLYVLAELRRHHDQVESSVARLEPAKSRREC